MPSKTVPLKYIYVRMSRSHDLDLLCLKKAGYNLSELLMTALASFANGRPCTITAYKDKDIDISSLNDSRIKCPIRRDDLATNLLLNSIKPGQRSAFCRALLRSTLSFNVIRPFLAKSDYDQILKSYTGTTPFPDPDFVHSIEDFNCGRAASNKIVPESSSEYVTESFSGSVSLPAHKVSSSELFSKSNQGVSDFRSGYSLENTSKQKTSALSNASASPGSGSNNTIPFSITVDQEYKPDRPDFTDDNSSVIYYNDDVGHNNDVTDLIDEFPGLFG